MVLMRIQKDGPRRCAVLGLGLAGLLAVVVGCDSTSDVTQSAPQGEENPGVARQKARQEAYGKAGVPTGKQAGPAAPKK